MDEFLAELTEPLFRFLVRMTRDPELAADLTQETLLRAWRHRRTLRSASSRRTWMFRVAVNLYRDERRRSAARVRERVECEQIPAGDPTPDLQASQRELQQRVLTALDQLPERQREVMYLRVIEQLAPREIAEILDIDARTVRSNLAVARNRLRGMLPDLVPPRSQEACRPHEESTSERGVKS